MSVLNGHIKESYEISMVFGAGPYVKLLPSPPAYLCAVTYLTEISFHATLSNEDKGF